MLLYLIHNNFSKSFFENPLKIYSSEDKQKPIKGLALSLELNLVGVIIFGNERFVQQGFLVYRSYSIISINVSKNIIGRVIDGV